MSARLPAQPGEWIDRKRPVSFSFEGKTYSAFVGDSVSSALWAAGEKVLGRSFKYHRPRGIFSLANHDINVMVEDGVKTNMRADVLPVTDGMVLKAVNTAGGVKNDIYSVLGLLAPLLPTGFYYKAFHTPRALFPMWESLIRRLAGLGVMNPNAARVMSPKQSLHCDVLVVGSGPAGLSAALTAAKHGASVILAEENPQLGGSLNHDHGGERDAADLLEELRAEVSANNNIAVQLSSYGAGWYTDNLVPLVGPSGMSKVRAQAIIVAGGAFEQPTVFRNNDLPGVMLGSAAQRLINCYAVKPFQRGVVLAGNAQAYRVALDLLKAGVKLAAVVDLRSAPDPQSAAIEQCGVAVYRGHCIQEATGSSGVEGVRVCPWDGQGNVDQSRAVFIPCDGVAMSVGWAPAAALLYQSGGKMRFDAISQQFVPERLPENVYAAGRINGLYGLEGCLADGERAALAALGKDAPAARVASESASYPWAMVEHAKGKNFLDFDEDLQLKDFANAAQEGFDNIELMKRFTTVGMGPSQGKHSNMNAIRVLAKLRGEAIEKVGSTTARPFFHPVPLGHLAGRTFHPERHTPLHGWHQAHGATFVTVGAWQRPAYYGEDKSAAIAAEVNAVRNAAGIIDVGTLGKFEVRGAQAAELLERFYTGHFVRQKPGTTRYALLLDESGVIVDDGVVARFADDLFYVTASTSNAAAVYREMTRWLQRWGLDATIVNLTGSYGALNLAGPLSMQLLGGLTPTDLNVLAQGAAIETEVAGVPARVINVRFVAETAYEIHAPAQGIAQIWDALHSAGKPLGLKAFGTDSQRLLRLEMGHFIVGHDTDGLTQPLEAGLDWALANDKEFYIGQRSLQIQARKPLAKRLVGFTLEAGTEVLPEECCLVIRGGKIAGRVTSIAASPTLDKVIGLAYVAPEDAAPGTHFNIRRQDGLEVSAIVSATPFVGTGS
jgi:sarcosine oxidase, subunit alpha